MLWPSAQGLSETHCGASWKASVCVDLCRREPWRAGRREDRLDRGPTMVVTQLSLEFRFQGKKLRGFSCELTRSPHGVLPESVLSTTCQVAIPILLSGLGMMTAGLVMNTVQVRTGLQGRGDRQGGGQEPGCSLWAAGLSWSPAPVVLVRRYLGLPAP